MYPGPGPVDRVAVVKRPVMKLRNSPNENCANEKVRRVFKKRDRLVRTRVLTPSLQLGIWLGRRRVASFLLSGCKSR